MNVDFVRLLDRMIAYENDELGEPETIALFQDIIDAKLLRNLQGHYGRTASDLIAAGYCNP